MTDPLTTNNIDVDAVPEATVVESQAPAGSANSPLPAVGTNAVSEWQMWDPNLWWTDWALPPDPRPSWELWFDWVNQLEALTPALGEASQDWQTMIGQFDEALRNVRNMRTEMADWTGPSAQTMSQSLDRLEDSIATKSAAIQNNPTKLQELAQTINDAVAPMSALDAEYQQVLQDLNACRQVAERGKPIMLNLATQLLQVGTDLENSSRQDNLAPQPAPQQPLALTDGPQGPSQQLTQVAGTGNLSDPGVVAEGGQTAVTEQPTVAGTSGVADPGAVQSGQQVATSSTPGVAVSPGDQTGAGMAATAPSSTQASPSPSLAGVSAGSAAPTLPASAGPVGAAPAPTPTMAPSGTMMPAPQFMAAPPATAGSGMTGTGVHGAASAVTPVPSPVVTPPQDRKGDKDVAAVVRVPVPVVASGAAVSGSAAVPEGLRGRTGDSPQPGTVNTAADRRDNKPNTAARRQDDGESLDAEAFTVEDAGTGTVTAPR